MLFKELQPVAPGESLPCEGIGWQECEAFPDVSLSSIWDEIQVSACMMGPRNWGMWVLVNHLNDRSRQLLLPLFSFVLVTSHNSKFFWMRWPKLFQCIEHFGNTLL